MMHLQAHVPLPFVLVVRGVRVIVYSKIAEKKTRLGNMVTQDFEAEGSEEEAGGGPEGFEACSLSFLEEGRADEEDLGVAIPAKAIPNLLLAPAASLLESTFEDGLEASNFFLVDLEPEGCRSVCLGSSTLDDELGPEDAGTGLVCLPPLPPRPTPPPPPPPRPDFLGLPGASVRVALGSGPCFFEFPPFLGVEGAGCLSLFEV